MSLGAAAIIDPATNAIVGCIMADPTVDKVPDGYPPGAYLVDCGDVQGVNADWTFTPATAGTPAVPATPGNAGIPAVAATPATFTPPPTPSFTGTKVAF